jgi:light-regulated signal transduction histidine kinase (bacteriophytochrome)
LQERTDVDSSEHEDTIPAELEKLCGQEPIHLIGAVQAYGFLLVVDIASARIVAVSSGIAGHWPGLPAPEALVDTPLADWVESIQGDGRLELACLPAARPVPLPWRARFERTGGAPPAQSDTDAAPCPAAHWECVGHRSGAVAVLEWLPMDGAPEEAHHQSRIFGDFGAMLARLRQPGGLDPFLQECVQVVQQLTGFDRVMIYRFLPDGAGEVVAEHTGPGYEIKYLGMRFPSSDIPSQARNLFLVNKVRILADVEASMDALVPPRLPGGEPLDQTFCLLRGLSRVHLSYLHNMGVRATLTMAVVCAGKLCGLIACHHHLPSTHPHHVRPGLRQVCELVAEITDMRVEALSNLEQMRRRLALDRLLGQFHQALIMDGDISVLLDDWLTQLLEAFNATNLGVRIGTLAYVGGAGARHASAQPGSATSTAIVSSTASSGAIAAIPPITCSTAAVVRSTAGRASRTMPCSRGNVAASRAGSGG